MKYISSRIQSSLFDPTYSRTERAVDTERLPQIPFLMKAYSYGRNSSLNTTGYNPADELKLESKIIRLLHLALMTKTGSLEIEPEELSLCYAVSRELLREHDVAPWGAKTVRYLEHGVKRVPNPRMTHAGSLHLVTLFTVYPQVLENSWLHLLTRRAAGESLEMRTGAHRLDRYIADISHVIG